MKTKVLMCIVILLLLISFFSYIMIMAIFEEPIKIDVTQYIQFNTTSQTIVLPWFIPLASQTEFERIGEDLKGNQYSEFYYELPDMFESAEMYIVVSWRDCRATAFVGESRAMGIIRQTYPDIIWSYRR